MGVDLNVTLQGLAQRLEALERENADLRHKVARLQDSGTTRRLEESAAEPDGRVSRRWLLGKAGPAAAGLVAATALTQGHMPHAKADPTVFTTTTADRGAVEGSNPHTAGYGVWGNSGTGVYGTGFTGVLGETAVASSFGVFGRNTNDFGGVGVYGQTEKGDGVRGDVLDPGDDQSVGVSGRNAGGVGVLGRGLYGVQGKSSDEDSAAVWGLHEGFGRGVVGECTQGTGVEGSGNTGVYGASIGGYAGVLGRHFGMGAAVKGESGIGYGGVFRGGRAPLRLVPAITRGQPTTGSHAKGEIYMDSGGALFVCTKIGTPGTWVKISTTEV